VIEEIKRIIRTSEILKSVDILPLDDGGRLTTFREDDAKWPQKNKDGRQELEIKIGGEHINFEVRSPASICWSYK
jgi:protein mago nashi